MRCATKDNGIAKLRQNDENYIPFVALVVIMQGRNAVF